MRRTTVAALLTALAVVGLSPTTFAAPKPGADVKKSDEARQAGGWARVAAAYQSYRAKHDQNYVMWTLDYASCCLLAGNYDEAGKALMEARDDIQKHWDKTREDLAAIGRENIKLFKGEPFERAMLSCYLGMLRYLDGDYNNARIFFSQANKENATKGNDMAAFRDDFGLAHYWLGRSYMKLDQPDNARIAFHKAAQQLPHKGQDKEQANLKKTQDRQRKERVKVEQNVYKAATAAEKTIPGVIDMSATPTVAELPDRLPGWPEADSGPVELCTDKPAEFFSVDYQQQVNLILVVEAGTAPIKYSDDYGDHIVPSLYDERGAIVYIDGHRAGPAFPVLEMYHQAATRGTSEKDAGQVAKGVTKAVLKRMPMGVGTVASLWQVQADERFWHMLPGQVELFAAKVTPGLHTVSLQCFDANGYVLPRYRMTCYYIPVQPDKDNIYILRTKVEADNVYVVASK